MDDLLVKGRESRHHVANLHEAFVIMWQYKMRFNSMKYVFSFDLGKFLGLMVLEKEIKANIEKIKAIFDMEPPININEL